MNGFTKVLFAIAMLGLSAEVLAQSQDQFLLEKGEVREYAGRNCQLKVENDGSSLIFTVNRIRHLKFETAKDIEQGSRIARLQIARYSKEMMPMHQDEFSDTTPLAELIVYFTDIDGKVEATGFSIAENKVVEGRRSGWVESLCGGLKRR